MQNDEDQEQEADTGYNWTGLNLQLVPSNECLSFKGQYKFVSLR